MLCCEKRETYIYIPRKGIHRHEAVLCGTTYLGTCISLFFMKLMFHAFTLLIALDHIEASVSIPLGVHPSFFQHHRVVLVEKKNMNTQYCISFLSRPTARHIGYTLQV